MGGPVVERTWVVGPLTVVGPTKVDSMDGRPHDRPMWRVVAIDAVTEDMADKVFTSAHKAQAFIDELVGGHAPVDPLDNEAAGPGNGTRPPTRPAPPTLNGHHVRIDTKAGETLATHGETAPFNLSAVSDALVNEGLDPFVEIARALKQEEPVLKANGEPRLDADGKPVMKRTIGPAMRASILVELGQYLQPKLKAVELKVEDKRQLTEAQLNERIEAIMRRAEQAAAHQTPTKDAGR